MRGIIGRIKIDDDVRGTLLSSPDKHVDQKIIQRVDAFGLRLPDFKDHVAFFDGLLGFAACKRVMKTVDGRTTRQRSVLTTRIESGDRLEQRIAPQQLSIVAVGVSGEDLIEVSDLDVLKL